VAEEREDEATIVRARNRVEPTFSVLVRRNVPGGDTAPPDVRPFFKDEVSIGRGARQVVVDLRLEGDLEVSRHHATLNRNGDGDFTITCKGANPIVLNDDREIAAGEGSSVKPGDKITICSYELMIQ
jgi:pSer/pThr/pTyr-binding forkhead associated (FHA) protein